MATQSQAFAVGSSVPFALADLSSAAPQFLGAARRFGRAGLLPVDLVDRIGPDTAPAA